MPPRSSKKIKPKIWIPPLYSTMYKIEVIRKDGTVDDITDNISSMEIEDGVTESIGTFRFELWNPNETYTTAWTGNEVFNYYSDYATTATTKRFRGRIEKPSKRDNKIVVTGRREGVKLIDVTVTQQYTNTETSLILKDLIDKYGDGNFTTTNVNVSTTSLTVNWYQKPFWDCVTELKEASNFECYEDSSLDFHYFLTGSRINTTEGIVHEHNLISVGDFAPDLALVKNRIIVYGAEVEGAQIIYTAESTDTDYGVDSDFGVREEIVSNDNVTTYQQAIDLAEATLSQRQTPPILGEVQGILLATVQPGESIRLSSPENGLDPGTYECVKYKHTINIESGNLTTTITVTKEPRKIYHIMKTLINNQNKTKNVSVNPYEMRFTYNFLFDSDEGSHSNTEITDRVLKLVDGQSSGAWTSPTRTITSNVTEIYLVVVGTKLTGATYQVSGTGGTSWEDTTNKSLLVLSTAIGLNLRIRVSITDTETQIDSLSLQYKVE